MSADAPAAAADAATVAAAPASNANVVTCG